MDIKTIYYAIVIVAAIYILIYNLLKPKLKNQTIKIGNIFNLILLSIILFMGICFELNDIFKTMFIIICIVAYGFTLVYKKHNT
jgi:4-hydroxybenzoate polyprenyltransferase